MVKLEVEVTPRARGAGIVGRRGRILKVKVVAPPAENRANHELVAVVAHLLRVAPGNIRIIRGGTSRRKLLEVGGITEADLAAALAAVPIIDT